MHHATTYTRAVRHFLLLVAVLFGSPSDLPESTWGAHTHTWGVDDVRVKLRCFMSTEKAWTRGGLLVEHITPIGTHSLVLASKSVGDPICPANTDSPSYFAFRQL